MKIAVSVETAADLSKEIIKEKNIETIALSLMLGEDVKIDGEIDIDEVFAYTDNTGKLPKTSAINQFEFTEYFTKLLNSYDAVVHITLSSGVSATCNNAIAAAKELKNVYVVDSQSLSTGIGLLALYACELRDKNCDAKTIYEKLTERANNIQASFVIDRLDFLCKGGRCSKLALMGANLLKLHPQIIVSEGKLGAYKKFRGQYVKVVEEYVKATLEQFPNADLENVFVTHTHASPAAVEVAKKLLQEKGFKNIYETVAGATISSHCGKNTLGVLYFLDAPLNLK
jgi:DegV family protein with EDD domain